MVCRRCVSRVKEIFSQQGFIVSGIDLGTVTYHEKENEENALGQVRQLLEAEGFEILAAREHQLIGRIKEIVENYLSGGENRPGSFARQLSAAVNREYGTISALFSVTEGLTLERYIIERRIEKVKGLLRDTPLSLTDMANALGYCSVAHLSHQFKSVTGLTPSGYRKLMRAPE